MSTVDASKTLVPLGLRDGRRDDGYLSGAITVEDLLALGGGGLQGESYIVVLGNNPDPVVNGAELKAAYDIAAASTPYGLPRGNQNPFTIIIAPGIYDMRAYNGVYGWELTAPYVNLRGLTANYDSDKRTDVQISTFCANAAWSEYTGLDTTTFFNGQILIGEDSSGTSSFTNCHAGPYSFGTGTQGMFGLSCAFKDCSAGSNSFGSCMSNSVPAPYIIPPGADISADIKIYRSFENCTAGQNSFGVSLFGNVNVNARFKNCIIDNGNTGFGVSIQGNVSMFGASFTDCGLTGQQAFGYSALGDVGITGGKFSNCYASGNAFGSAQGPNSSVTIDGSIFNDCIVDGASPGFAFGETLNSVNGGTIITGSCTFNNCQSGYISFGVSGGSASVYGIFNNCTARGYSFAYNPNDYQAQAYGTFTDCTVTLGSGGPNEGAFGANLASGVFTNCKVLGNSGQWVFGYGSTSPGQGGTANGSFYNCISTVNTGSFGRTASGVFMNCSATQLAFGDTEAPGSFYNCVAGINSFGGNPAGNLNGTFINCVASTNSFGNNDTTLTSKLNGKAFYCVKTNGSFYPSVGGTKAVLCIDGTNTIKTV